MLAKLLLTVTSTEDELQQILLLQKENLEQQVGFTEAKEQGFVTVVHNMQLLREMNEVEPSVIAKYNEKVVGYCLSMPRIFKTKIEVLTPMFEKIDALSFEGRSLNDCNYLVMGQVCINKNYRGMGIFDQMYEFMQAKLSQKYDYLITEVASRNTRSMRAHTRVGFENLLTFADQTDHWELVIWNWGEKFKNQK
ncbi:MAG: GNAT family N-acetyltransferase [Chitinophagales bacterium]